MCEICREIESSHVSPLELGTDEEGKVVQTSTSQTYRYSRLHADIFGKVYARPVSSRGASGCAKDSKLQAIDLGRRSKGACFKLESEEIARYALGEKAHSFSLLSFGGGVCQ